MARHGRIGASSSVRLDNNLESRVMGAVSGHGPESWPGMLRNWWPATTGIRNNMRSCT